MPKKLKKHTLFGLPQEKQKQFFEATEKYVAYGGARGGGKSWALRRKVILMCLKYPGLCVLVVRRSFPELRENHIRPMKKELSGLADFVESRKSFEFKNGSVIKLGYCDSENDVDRYQGQEFDIIALDEATQLTEYQFQTFKACLRGANDFPKRMYITCNPGGVGHGWVKRLFIDREYKAYENPDDYRFIPAKVYDNKALLTCDPEYLLRLQSLPKGLRDAWLLGKWDAFAGQFFPEFDMDLHTVAPVFPDENHTKYCAIDYGLDMLAAIFVAVDQAGHATVYDEVYQSGLVVSEAARLINEKAYGVCTFIAPSDLWARQKDSGKSIAELFCENGVYLTKINPDRIGGWMCLKEWIKPISYGDGRRDSMLKICRNCTNLIRSLPQLMHDTKRPQDAATQPHEITHAPDALRYFASFRTFAKKNSEKGEKRMRLCKELAKKNAKNYNF